MPRQKTDIILSGPRAYLADQLHFRENLPEVSHARFRLGGRVRHRLFGFRGIIFDVDPIFANSQEWYDSIPEDIRPDRDQPFYHIIADNGEASYVAYVSQQNLVHDDALEEEPIEHPAIAQLFSRDPDGQYDLHAHHWQ